MTDDYCCSDDHVCCSGFFYHGGMCCDGQSSPAYEIPLALGGQSDEDGFDHFLYSYGNTDP